MISLCSLVMSEKQILLVWQASISRSLCSMYRYTSFMFAKKFSSILLLYSLILSQRQVQNLMPRSRQAMVRQKMKVSDFTKNRSEYAMSVLSRDTRLLKNFLIVLSSVSFSSTLKKLYRVLMIYFRPCPTFRRQWEGLSLTSGNLQSILSGVKYSMTFSRSSSANFRGKRVMVSNSMYQVSQDTSSCFSTTSSIIAPKGLQQQLMV